MTSFHSHKEDLQQLCTDMSTYLGSASELQGVGVAPFKEWEMICQAIKKQLDEEIVRVAVVGAIKSGKSTFVNSLFKADYLNRGAGVVTSIVTRVRQGPYLKAKLYFKSWDDVNEEISGALTLFPAHAWESEETQFDIRREGDRRALTTALQNIQSNLLLTNGIRNTNSILIDSYLKGYDLVKDIITSDHLSKVYEDDLFGEQKMFVGSDHLAVYLKDVLLEIRGGDMGNDIEIADCQGSDSPNPLHLSMIQDYLLKTHLIIYVISSRTGLRQADMRFLSIIRNMGILENILFVLNSDFSEHETLDGLTALVDRTREDLSIITPDPDIYIFSSLYNLFKASFKAMSRKDELRFSHWEADAAFIAFSDGETKRFNTDFFAKLGKEHYSLLVKNNIERLSVISESLAHWSDIHKEILSGDAKGVASLISKMTYHQQQMTQIASLVKNTLEGASRNIKQNLKQIIDRFFDVRNGPVVKDMIAFIRNFQFNLEPYESSLESSRFTEMLYLVFQDFKAAVDSHLAETIHPRIVRFIREEEEKIKSHLESVATPYAAMVKEAMADYQAAMADTGASQPENPGSRLVLADLKVLRLRDNLRLPPVETTMRYSARIKTEAVMRFGFYSVIKAFRKLLKKSESRQNHRKQKALEDGFRRMKLETERSISVQFRDYQENVKFQYLFRLTDVMVQQLNDDLRERFKFYFTDASKMIETVKEEHLDKERIKEGLQKIGVSARDFLARIEQLRESTK
ncbi:MAG: dynamin family protein [Desulfobacterales bacterium]|nr:dynamin family protein [Desulfobacterales bacterium]MDX2513081.1 dynamin family protein [Desulfobacterales bacterium]